MKKIHLVTMSAIALFSATGSQAQELLCGGSYEIQQGDILSQIAGRVFGDDGAFMRFYDDPRNAETLSDNPDVIYAGDRIYLPPCAGDEQPLEELEGTTDASLRELHIVTGSDFAPFTDENLPDGGMLTKVVADTFTASDIENLYTIDFVNDWGSHLETLIPRGLYDFGFPWYKPNCEKRDELSTSMQKRCDLVWSDPLFSVAIGFYAPASLENPPQNFNDLHGKNICRPDGYFTFDLEERGLVNDATIKLIQPVTVAECFQLLETGEVDFVSLNRFTAEKAIAREGLTGLVEPLETIVSTQSLHLVAHPNNPDAVALLDEFNAALKKLQDSGRYSAISNKFMKIHQEEVEALAQE